MTIIENDKRPTNQDTKQAFSHNKKLDKQRGSAWCKHHSRTHGTQHAAEMINICTKKTSQTYHSQYHSSASITSTDLQLSAVNSYISCFYNQSINQSNKQTNKRSISPEFPLCLQKIPGRFSRTLS